MTNQEIQKLIDEGVAILKTTTVGYAKHSIAWQNNKSTQWWKGLDKLSQARAALNAPVGVTYVFDGRAINQVFLPASGSATHATPSTPVPGNDLWNCIYLNSDITLVQPDARWGKTYKARLTRDSKNPWGVPPLGTWQGAASVSCELTHVRSVNPGDVDWYAQSYKLHPGWTAERFNIISQLGYPTLSSPPIAFNVSPMVIGLDLDGGVLTEAGHPGWWGGSHSERLRYPTADTTNKWVDLILGVKWTLDNTGWIIFATRLEGEAAFTTRYNEINIPTYQQHPNIPESIPWKTQCMDKQGAYVGYHGNVAPPADWEISCELRGLSRHSSYADAKLALE